MKKFTMIKCDAVLTGAKSIGKMAFYSWKEFEDWKIENKDKIKGIYDLREVEYNQ